MAESEAKLKKTFAALDENKDGFLTDAEIQSVLTKKGVTYDAAAVSEAFKSLDKDGDTKLSEAEFLGLLQEPLRSKFLPVFNALNA